MSACKVCNKIHLSFSVFLMSKMWLLFFSWYEFFYAAWVGLTRQSSVDILYRKEQGRVSYGLSNHGYFASLHGNGDTWNAVIDKSSGDVGVSPFYWTTFCILHTYELTSMPSFEMTWQGITSTKCSLTNRADKLSIHLFQWLVANWGFEWDLVLLYGWCDSILRVMSCSIKTRWWAEVEITQPPVYGFENSPHYLSLHYQPTDGSTSQCT